MQPAEGFARIITAVQQSDIEVFLRYVQIGNRQQPPPQRSWRKTLHLSITAGTHQPPGSDSAAGAAQATWRQDKCSSHWAERAAPHDNPRRNVRNVLSNQAAVQLSQNSSDRSPSSVNGGSPEGDQVNGRRSVSSRTPAETQHRRPSAGAGKHSGGMQHGASALPNAWQATNLALLPIDVSAGVLKQPKAPSNKAKCATLLLTPRPGLACSSSSDYRDRTDMHTGCAAIAKPREANSTACWQQCN